MRSYLYFGSVQHKRVKPRFHKFLYKVFTIYIDLENVNKISNKLFFFGYNKFSLISFNDIDHGPRDGSSVLKWIRSHLKEAGFAGDGKIYLQCYPRVFGYVFNPLSVYFCYDKANNLEAVLYEVKNTFKDQHSYLVSIENDSFIMKHFCNKKMFVSPFNKMDHIYKFILKRPNKTFFLGIIEKEKSDTILYATFKGYQKPLTDLYILLAIVKYPLMTIKVISAIHWEALILWIKGVPLAEKPNAKSKEISYSIKKK